MRLDSGVASLGSYSTLVFLVPAHPNVSLLAPAGTPGVLYNPVVFTIHGAISNSQYSVIQPGGRAPSLIVHSGSVQLHELRKHI